jgi:hypothetical protein
MVAAMSTVMTTPLLDFYVRLGEDESLLEEFERDPQAALEGAGFSEDAIATLLEGDLDAVRAILRDEIRSTPRSEYEGPGEHTGEHTQDDEPGEHTGDDEPGEHTGDDEPGEHTGEHTPDE